MKRTPFPFLVRLRSGFSHSAAADGDKVRPFVRATVADGRFDLKIYEKVFANKIKFPRRLKGAKSLADAVAALCTIDPLQRLGCNHGGVAGLKAHVFFRGVPFPRLQEASPPFTPTDSLEVNFGDDWGDEEEPAVPYQPSGAPYEALWDQEF